MATRAERILQTNHLRNTAGRAEVLDTFLVHDHALAHRDIEEKLSSQLDRVTLYRTLKTFLDKGIIHKVLDDTGNIKYALCGEACPEEEHNHNHVHFKCTSCGHTMCLEQVLIPSVSLPRGYRYAEANLLIHGVCDKCSTE